MMPEITNAQLQDNLKAHFNKRLVFSFINEVILTLYLAGHYIIYYFDDSEELEMIFIFTDSIINHEIPVSFVLLPLWLLILVLHLILQLTFLMELKTSFMTLIYCMYGNFLGSCCIGFVLSMLSS